MLRIEGVPPQLLSKQQQLEALLMMCKGDGELDPISRTKVKG